MKFSILLFLSPEVRSLRCWLWASLLRLIFPRYVYSRLKTSAGPGRFSHSSAKALNQIQFPLVLGPLILSLVSAYILTWNFNSSSSLPNLEIASHSHIRTLRSISAANIKAVCTFRLLRSTETFRVYSICSSHQHQMADCVLSSFLILCQWLDNNVPVFLYLMPVVWVFHFKWFSLPDILNPT